MQVYFYDKIVRRDKRLPVVTGKLNLCICLQVWSGKNDENVNYRLDSYGLCVQLAGCRSPRFHLATGSGGG